MRIGLLTLPLGLFGSIVVIVLVVLFANVVGKRRHAGRVIITGAAALFVLLFILSFLGVVTGLMIPAMHRAMNARPAVVTQAHDQVAHAQAMVEQTRKQIEAQAAEVQAKTDQIRRQAEAEVDRIHAATFPVAVKVYDRPAATAIELTNIEDQSYVDPGTGQHQAGAQPATAEELASYEDPTIAHGAAGTHIASPEEVAGNEAPAVQYASGVLIAGQPWSGAVEEHQDFEADVYPSIEAAAEALGRRVGQKLVSTLDTGEKPKPMIYVWRDGVAGHTENQNGEMIVTRELLEAVAAGLRQKLEEPAYVSVEQPPTPDDIAVNVAVPEVSFENHNRWRTHAESRSGSIALRVQAPDGPFSISTRFADTPWLIDRTGFVRQYANGDWLVAYSDGTDSTHEGAREDALNAATDVLLPLAQARISQLPASDQHRFAQQMAEDPNWLRSRVADELVTRNLVTDRFAQRFDRSYGTVWREAVLVDASPTRVEAIARSLVQGVDAKVTYQRNTWFSFIALAGLIFGTYLFLNMATKGYYAWMLRLAAVGGVAAAGFLVMHLL